MRVVRMLTLATVAALAAGGFALAGPATDATDGCGLLVCGSAASDLSVSCGKAQDAYTSEWFAWCTVTMSSHIAGSSPVFLPGRIDGSGVGHISFTCLNGCASRNVDESVPLAAAWRGGPVPGPLGLGNSGQADAQVLRVTTFTYQNLDGRPACVHANASLATRATATVLDVNGTAVPLERVVVEDLRTGYGDVCV